MPIDSAMISDVPATPGARSRPWPRRASSISPSAPNYFDRIGTILVEWENKPFYWVGPDGQSEGAGLDSRSGATRCRTSTARCRRNSSRISATGWRNATIPTTSPMSAGAGHGDNAVPDPAICDFVKDWNAKYAWPQFMISGDRARPSAPSKSATATGCRRCAATGRPTGKTAPARRPPKPGMNRAQLRPARAGRDAVRHAQARRLPGGGLRGSLEQRAALLRAHLGRLVQRQRAGSQETRDQWDIKQSYARRRTSQSRDLLAKALGAAPSADRQSQNLPAETLEAAVGGIDIVQHALLAAHRARRVARRDVPGGRSASPTRRAGRSPSQRLTTRRAGLSGQGRAAVCGPALYRRRPATPAVEARATAGGAVLDNGLRPRAAEREDRRHRRVDAPGASTATSPTPPAERPSTIISTWSATTSRTSSATARSKITVGESGPLVASLRRRVRRARAATSSRARSASWPAGDYVEFATLGGQGAAGGRELPWRRKARRASTSPFPFHVPDGDMLLDIPLGVMRPEADQMPSACKNWLTVGRWADVSNQDCGVTWVTLDAPLVASGRHHRHAAQLADQSRTSGGRQSSRRRSSTRGP